MFILALKFWVYLFWKRNTQTKQQREECLPTDTPSDMPPGWHLWFGYWHLWVWLYMAAVKILLEILRQRKQVNANPWKHSKNISNIYFARDLMILCLGISNERSLQTNLFENALDNALPSVPYLPCCLNWKSQFALLMTSHFAECPG